MVSEISVQNHEITKIPLQMHQKALQFYRVLDKYTSDPHAKFHVFLTSTDISKYIKNSSALFLVTQENKTEGFLDRNLGENGEKLKEFKRGDDRREGRKRMNEMIEETRIYIVEEMKREN